MNPDDRARGLHVLAEDTAKQWQELVSAVDSLVASGAPLRALMVALAPTEELERNRWYQTAAQWARERHSGILMLVGDPGVGKSIAAARYVLSEDTRRRGVAWVQAGSLGMDDFAEANRRLRRLIRVPCLVLDELGGQGSTGRVAVERLGNLITERHGAGRPTVITTNKDKEQIAAIYDAVEPQKGERASDRSRIMDRVREGGCYLVCKREEGSFRRSGNGASPDSRANRYRIAKRGAYLFELLGAGSVDSKLLDEVQDMLCVDDEQVRQAAQSCGFTPEVQAMIARSAQHFQGKTDSLLGLESDRARAEPLRVVGGAS